MGQSIASQPMACTCEVDTLTMIACEHRFGELFELVLALRIDPQ